MDEAERLEAAAEAEKEFHDLPLDDAARASIVNWGMRNYPKCGYRKLGLIVSQRESFSPTV